MCEGWCGSLGDRSFTVAAPHLCNDLYFYMDRTTTIAAPVLGRQADDVEQSLN